MKLRFVAIFTLICLVIGIPIMAFAKEDSVVITPQITPQILSCSIVLPEEVKKKYSEQTISLKVLISISIEGRVGNDVQLIDSSGDSIIDDIVMESVKKFRFIPARQDYKTIPSKVKLPIQFVNGKYVIENGEMVNESQNEV